MNRDDIIRMAREAQLGTSLIHKGGEQRVWIEGADWHDELERFAALVAAAEREACELTVDSLIISGPVSEVQQRYNWAYMHARDAIRARGRSNRDE